jgi:hypothetical protein
MLARRAEHREAAAILGIAIEVLLDLDEWSD